MLPPTAAGASHAGASHAATDDHHLRVRWRLPRARAVPPVLVELPVRQGLHAAQVRPRCRCRIRADSHQAGTAGHQEMSSLHDVCALAFNAAWTK